jgi:tetratricopeptide (TPR) repeat protein
MIIDRDIGHRQGEGFDLEYLGLCYFSLGEYQRAIDLHAQAIAIARDIGHRYLEAIALDSTGRAWLASGDERRAVVLLGQAIEIADITGDVEPAMEARSWLARAHLQLGDAAAALAVTAVERGLAYPLEKPVMHLLEGVALLKLNRPDQSAQAFTEALAAADGLLGLADRNVAALEVRALALSGLAVVEGDPARAAEAAEAFAEARAVTRAPGVVSDTRRLLGIVMAHDHSGILDALDPD